MGMQLIETIEVGSGGAASIEFTSIPQTGVDLILKTSLRASSTNYQAKVGINNASGTYSSIYLLTNNGFVNSNTSLKTFGWGHSIQNQSDFTANTFSNNSLTIPNYTGSELKLASYEGVSENNGTNNQMIMFAGIAPDSSAVTSVKVIGELVQYSTASLYLISAD